MRCFRPRHLLNALWRGAYSLFSTEDIFFGLFGKFSVPPWNWICMLTMTLFNVLKVHRDNKYIDVCVSNGFTCLLRIRHSDAYILYIFRRKELPWWILYRVIYQDIIPVRPEKKKITGSSAAGHTIFEHGNISDLKEGRLRQHQSVQ